MRSAAYATGTVDRSKSDAMRTATQHHEPHLAPIYVWMVGGIESALARGEAEIETLWPGPGRGRVAVDLGAGFGMHAIPLARRGYSVVAIDSSAVLLSTLRDHADALPLRVVEDDLQSFSRHLDTQADLVLCMGDTLTHVPDRGAVDRVISEAADVLRTGGQFVATFRDYSVPLREERRFIHVRSDRDRVLICFLEYGPDHVAVYDVLHERDGDKWQPFVSAYRKLRLSPNDVSRSLQEKGFVVRVEPGQAGMIRIVATRVSPVRSHPYRRS